MPNLVPLSPPRMMLFAIVADPSTRLVFAMAAANRDPLIFHDADQFDLQRDNLAKALSFGPGPRLCPGMHLARKQLAVVLDVLLARLPDLRLTDIDAALPVGTILRGPEHLPVAY